MKCPCCGNDLRIEDRVYLWLESYGSSAKARTLCCNKLVRVHKITSYEAVESSNQNGEDDWGN